MRGFPKNFETKQDYMNSLSMYPEQTKARLRGLLADRFSWQKTADLESAADGISDETHRVSGEKSLDKKGNETVKYIQLEWLEDSNAALFRLGFTVSELEDLTA